MSESTEPEGQAPLSTLAAVKACPWCQGPLAFEGRFPVVRLMPGDTRFSHPDEIPEPLRTIPAWVCVTPLCKYREVA